MMSVDTPSIAFEEDIYSLNEDSKRYLYDISKIPLLSEEETRALFKEYRETGSEIAKQKLWESNLRLVAYLAKKYVGCGVCFLDLVQEGNIGLMKAIEKYVPGKAKFSTYASIHIRASFLKARDTLGYSVRIPSFKRNELRRIDAATYDLATALGRFPSTKELADKLELPEEKIADDMLLFLSPVSFDIPFDTVEEDDAEFLDEKLEDIDCSVEDTVFTTLAIEDVRELLQNLTERESFVLSSLFGFGDGGCKTLESTGKELGITRERVRQIEAKAIRKCKEMARHRNLNWI